MQEIVVPGYATVVLIPKIGERVGGTRVRLDGRPGRERAEWLFDTVGPGRPGAISTEEVCSDHHVWYSQVWLGYVAYHFKRAADATLFKLKFG